MSGESEPQAPPKRDAPPVHLLVDEVRIRDFRNLADVSVPLERRVTYLIGENNSGKSSVLMALASACGSRRATVDDLRHSPDGTRKQESVVDLLLVSEGETMADVVAQRLRGTYGSGPGPGDWFGVRTRFSASRESTFLVSDRSLLLWEAASQDWRDTGTAVRPEVMESLTAQLLGPTRDLVADFETRTSDWGRVLSNLGINDSSRAELEESLSRLGVRLQEASPVFSHLRERLQRIVDAQSGVDGISLEPLPVRLEELARSVDVLVESAEGEGLPLRFQGSGSRSLAALMVFAALCELRVGADLGVRPHLVTLLEEPEAHLHPQAQAGVRRIINELPGQVVTATHSHLITAEDDPRTVRILRRADDGTTVHQLTLESARKMAVFRRYIERPLGEVFFARSVVFVDGTAERITIPVFLSELLGRDCAGMGIAVVDLQGMETEQFNKAIEALEALGGIPWLAFVDSDSAGLDAISGCIGSDGEVLSPEHPQVVMSGEGQLERLLIDSGYQDEIREVANEYLPRTEDDPRHPEPRLPDYENDVDSEYLNFLSHNKGWAGELIAKSVVAREKDMPEPIIELASKLRQMISE